MPTALGEITNPTGGHTQVVHDTNELAAATARIAEELNTQYMLGYSSPNPGDGQFHSIRVKTTSAGYRVRARNGYLAVRADGHEGSLTGPRVTCSRRGDSRTAARSSRRPSCSAHCSTYRTAREGPPNTNTPGARTFWLSHGVPPGLPELHRSTPGYEC